MPTTHEDVERVFQRFGLRYFPHPERKDVFLFGVSGEAANYQIMVYVEMNGAWVQMQVLNLARVQAGSPHRDAVCRLLATLNHQYRALRLGMDPADGSVMGFVDLILADQAFSEALFGSTMALVLGILDRVVPRLMSVTFAGADPGEAPRPGGDKF